MCGSPLNNVSLLWESFTLFHRTGKRLLDLVSVKNKIRPIPCTPYIKLVCGSVPISDVTFEQIYDSVLGKKQTPPTAQQKIIDKYSDTFINREKVYSLPFCTTLDSKLREISIQNS